MIISVNSAEYLEGYRIRLSFNTGETGVVDLAEVLDRHPHGKTLKDINIFKDFYLDEWPTLAWPNGFDLSPEFLYELAMGRPYQWIEAS